MKVSIITLCWNHLEDVTKPFVEDILKTTGVDYEVIFVDNGSEDGTTEYLTERLKDVPNTQVLRLEENLRWNGGNNHGYKFATGEYLCFINNDVIVNDPLWLKKMVDYAEAHPKEAVGGELVDWQPAAEWNGENIPYLNGWLIMVHRKFCEEFGVFHPAFKTPYLEDVEFCVRLRKYGWDWHVMELGLKHLGARSSYDQIDMQGNANASRQTFLKLMGKIEKDLPVEEYLSDKI